MPINHVELEKELNILRDLAAEKWLEDPLPVGWAASERLKSEIAEYDLAQNIVDLEIDGYTILPPEKGAPLELVERIKAAMLRTMEESTNGIPAIGSGGSAGHSGYLWHLLPKDRAFEEAVLAPAPLVLVTYMLGYRAKLAQTTGLLKDGGSEELFLHADHLDYSAPFARQANVCNATWVLSDYTRENGAICVWPGSHRWASPVPPEMATAHDHEGVKVLETPAGSIIVFHGSLWHGNVSRTAEGRRLTLVVPYLRSTSASTEMYWATTTPEMIGRNPARFCALVDLISHRPWINAGPQFRGNAIQASGSQFE